MTRSLLYTVYSIQCLFKVLYSENRDTDIVIWPSRTRKTDTPLPPVHCSSNTPLPQKPPPAGSNLLKNRFDTILPRWNAKKRTFCPIYQHVQPALPNTEITRVATVVRSFKCYDRTHQNKNFCLYKNWPSVRFSEDNASSILITHRLPAMAWSHLV